MTLTNNRIVFIAAVITLLGWGVDALAAGLFLTPRGVRPLARGGAFIAGANDLNSLSYNPAGIALSDNELLLDLGLPIHSTEFERADTNGDGELEPMVRGKGLGLPSPTFGGVADFGWANGFRFAFGVAADYPLLQNWPDNLAGGKAAPQRYAIHNYTGTAISKLSLGAGYAMGDWLALGMSAQLLTGQFVATVTASNCSGGPLCVQPENPDFDAVIQMASDFIAIAGIHIGAIVMPVPWLKLALAWESGYSLDSGADIRVRLPSAAAFDDAVLSPDKPRGVVQMDFPWALRAGIEVSWADWAKTELAFVYEAWSVHDEIKIDVGGVMVENIVGIDDYPLASVSIQRNFRDTGSLRWGTELEYEDLSLRLGVAYEPAAISSEWLTPMAVDLDKTILSTGIGYQLGSVSIEATYALVLMPTMDITGSLARQVSATRPPFEERTYIGNGRYNSRAHVLGVGVHIAYDEFFH